MVYTTVIIILISNGYGQSNIITINSGELVSLVPSITCSSGIVKTKLKLAYQPHNGEELIEEKLEYKYTYTSKSYCDTLVKSGIRKRKHDQLVHDLNELKNAASFLIQDNQVVTLNGEPLCIKKQLTFQIDRNYLLAFDPIISWSVKDIPAKCL